MTRILCFFMMLACAVQLCASPARRVRKTIEVDGRSVEVTLTGNEYLHYWLADDGTAYSRLGDGTYARFDIGAARQSMAKVRRAAPQRRTSTHVDPILGKKRGLVILVETTDLKFTCSDNPQALFHDMMNKEGFNYGTATGSVRDYFLDQSFGKLDYEFDVVGPVTVSHDMAYYGGNPKYEFEAVAVCEMVFEAVKLVDKDVDFSQYDVDGDRVVENIYVIYPGYAEAHGAPEWTIWPHAWHIDYANWWNSKVYAPRCDGVKVDAYACSSEYRDVKGNRIDGIGTIVHEFSHCLGLPDWYNTQNAHEDYTNAYWSVLDAGTYGNDGDTPVAYTAYERWFCGWMEPVELKKDTVVSNLASIDKSQRAYIYYNEGNRNEFYILHNIQKEGWNKYAYDTGLAVFHVDLDDYAWEMDEVNNNPDHLRMQLICADNVYSFDSVWEDLYPNSAGNNRLTSTSKPACKVFNKNIDGSYMMGKHLTAITQNTKGEVSFKFSLTDAMKQATAIDNVAGDGGAEDGLYNMCGQRVDAGYRGIVISTSGKKIMRK